VILFQTEPYPSARYLAEQLVQPFATILEGLHDELHVEKRFFPGFHGALSSENKELRF
jgi:hypothetical protein